MVAALNHKQPAVRVHGLRLAEPWLDRSKLVRRKALSLVDDDHPTVVIQLAMSLGECDHPDAIETLTKLVSRRSDARWLHESVLSSINKRGSTMLKTLLAASDKSTSPPSDGDIKRFLRSLCAMIGAGRDADEISKAIVAVAGVSDLSIQAQCLTGLRSSFKTASPTNLSADARAALAQLSKQGKPPAREIAQSLSVAMRIESPAARRARLDRLTQLVSDVQRPVDQRLAAVSELAAEQDTKIVRALLKSFAQATPQIRKAILSAALSRRDRASTVLDAIEQNELPRSSLSAINRRLLREHPDEVVRRRAVKLFTNDQRLSDETYRRFFDELKAKPDLARGERMFRKHCADCHQARGIGFAVGPNLDSESKRPAETILADILAPSATITPGYASYAIETVDGVVVNGLLAGETAGAVRLREPGGKQQTVLRKDIANIKAIGVSLMPEELAKKLTPRDAANVIGWLLSPPDRRILFDEDPAFVDQLTDGEGTARIDREDPSRGAAALRISPPQKFSAKIEGWRFVIRERPEPGEFRYLRFAWKSAGASGVMIELANAGRWPSPDSPSFRYFSGRNTTGWQATEVSGKAPTEWTVVTRDLWKDFGDSEITGIAPTAMNGDALFDQIELWREKPTE